MTVKELINELLECEMEAEAAIQIKLNDQDLDYEEFRVELINPSNRWEKYTPYLVIDLENKTTEEFIESLDN